MTDSDPQAELIAAELRHAINSLRAEMRTAQSQLDHYRQLAEDLPKAATYLLRGGLQTCDLIHREPTTGSCDYVPIKMESGQLSNYFKLSWISTI